MHIMEYIPVLAYRLLMRGSRTKRTHTKVKQRSLS